ncbi:MAG TPA: Ppx/GppA phosphatase family protein [Acidimicrobiia bacterium]|nr:Ppx/GppA phosphatase family protein [Acidimicrobiia bacterium]
MRIAALDLGSNSFHLLVAEVHADGTFVAITREKEMLRLGDAVARDGFVPPETADAAVATVRRFRKLADAAGAAEVLACATSAIRTAANGDALVDRLERETGVSVDVIDGMEEARLIFGALRASVVLEPAPALCFDLGGGSVEVMVGDTSGLRWSTSERLGVARLTAELVDSDPLSKRDRARLRDRVTRVLEPVATAVASYEPGLVVGSSGTLEDVARMVNARRDGDVPVSLNQFTFTRDEFMPLHHELTRLPAAERRRIEGLEARRVDLIPAGAVFLDTVMDLFAFDQMTVSEWALREGLVLDAIGRHDPEDWSDDPRAIRRASVQSLARRCSSPEAHSRHVAALALDLFDQTTSLHDGAPDDRELLEYAALLHDIGEHVSRDGHDRHAAYLVRHGGLRGFDPDEVRVLTALVRWHRRGDPKSGDDAVPDLTDDERERVRRLAAILRVADGLDRGRHQVVHGVTARVGPSLVLVGVDAGGDPELELWAARRKRELFEKVFDRELELTIHPAAR